MKKLRTQAISLFLGLCLIGLSSPGAQAGDWSVPALMARLATVESRHVGYIEERHMSLLGVPLQTEGELFFRSPDYLKKTVTKGGEGTFEIQGETLRIEQHGEVSELPLSHHSALKAFVASFRATLAGDLVTLKHYYRLALSGQAEEWTLSLIPLEASMVAVIREIRIHGRGSEVLQVETLESGGDSTTLTIRGEGV